LARELVAIDSTRGVTLTVISAEPDALPDVAVMLAEPVATAMTSPLELTEATLDAEVVQDTLAPAITCPF